MVAMLLCGQEEVAARASGAGGIISLLASSCFVSPPFLYLFRLALDYGFSFLFWEVAPLAKIFHIDIDSFALEFMHGGTTQFRWRSSVLGYGSDIFSFLDLSCGLFAQLWGCWINSSIRRLRRCCSYLVGGGELWRLVLRISTVPWRCFLFRSSQIPCCCHVLDPLIGGDGLSRPSSTLNFLFGCFTVDTGGLLNESRASDTSVLKVGKRCPDCGLDRDSVTFESSVSGLVFGVEIRPNFGDEGVGVQYSRAISYSVSVFCPPSLSVRMELQCWG
ncbi:hypothetical protein F2Q69_00050251 [Brassica cretica]|uniref:Uncharacterized protein n=1 Tax=Brassica cretica TaxID=69181 RepID=A0A8S9PSD5_BRACR|nr:hypothetical protein F2Q69_00050251 [Brassica cretica]